MTTLPERLKELASRMNQDGDKYDAFTLLAEAAQALQAEPEGWVLVPREPTEEMIEAACISGSENGAHGWHDETSGGVKTILRDLNRKAYAAMLSAAKSAPIGQEG